jgi:hypothetical protein
MADQEVRFRDFSKKQTPIYFVVDDDRFDCVKGLSPIKLQEFVRTIRKNTTDESNAIDKILEAMKMILLPPSYERFIERMQGDDDKNLIDMEQLSQITEWVLEAYTGRPLAVSSTSSPQSANVESGTSSTDGVQPTG